MINHFILIKMPGYCASGKSISARIAALKLLEAGFWPIFHRTRNKFVMKSGDEIAVYLGGAYNQIVIATAKIESIEAWNREHAKNYPLTMDGLPETVLNLSSIHILKQAVDISEIRNNLSFIPKNSTKWGVAFMGGARKVSEEDFKLMTSNKS